MTGAELVIDLAAVRHDVALLRRTVAPAAVMAVVKADGYGHGMVEVAGAARAAGAEWIGVATIVEALALRAAGDEGPLLCWLTTPGADWAAAIDAGIDVTVYSKAELDEVLAATGERTARVQIKVDTGLSRGGAPREHWEDLFRAAADAERSGAVQVTGIWSHLACSDEPDHPANDAQQAAYEDALDLAAGAGLDPEVRHLANSAGALLRPQARYDLVRCGIAAYGCDPAPGRTDLPLRPAMTARAPLAMVKELPAGASVSYGHTWTADRPTRVGLVPVGYGDGIPRHASNTAEVLVGGRRCPVRGRICMDQFVVELGDLDAEPGDEVVLFGPGDRGEPTAQDWAEACGTINYEIVTRVGGRFTRRFVDSEADT